MPRCAATCAIAALFIAACATQTVVPTASPGVALDLSINNGTTIVVDLVVNGSRVRAVAPRTEERVERVALPPMPWTVETRTTAGRTLSSLVVRDGDITRVAHADGGVEMSGDGVRVDLSCGRIDVWVGPPILGPANRPGRPGDCDP